MLTREQLDLLRASWAEADRLAPEMVERFYDRLFRLAPYTRSYFTGDMEVQRVKFLQLLTLSLRTLEEPEAFRETMGWLGRRHREVGIREADFAPVGEALIGTLAETLGDRFESDTRDAWLVAYDLLSREMRRAIAAAEPDAVG